MHLEARIVVKRQGLHLLETIKELQKLKCAGIEASSALVAPGFATTTVNLAGNSSLPVAIPGVTAQRGSFEFIIEFD